jgi:hypothetical protein
MEKMGRGLPSDKNAACTQETASLLQPFFMVNQVLEHAAHDEGRISLPGQRIDVSCLNGQAEIATMRRHGRGGLDTLVSESFFQQEPGQPAPSGAHLGHVIFDPVVYECAENGSMMASRLSVGTCRVRVDVLGRGVGFHISPFQIFSRRQRDKLDGAAGGTAMIPVFAASPVEADNGAACHT